MDKLDIFYANQTSMCFDPHENKAQCWYRKNMFKLSRHTDPSKVVLYYECLLLFVFKFAFCDVCFVALWPFVGKV